MKLFVTTASGIREGTYVTTVEQLANIDRVGIHRLTSSASNADLILFVDAHLHSSDFRLSILRNHPLVRRHRDKTFIYNELDEPWCALPGLYTSMPRRYFNRQRQQACPYLTPEFNPYILDAAGTEPPDLLFSFMGRDCYPPRGRVLRLRHPRAVVEDTSNICFFLGETTASKVAQQLHYAQTINRSKFVLCPRGGGTSSYRLFEVISAGRVPVIISDQWVPPPGPAWDRFSLRFAEADVERVPQMLESAEPKYEEMSVAVQAAWQDWFSADVLFHHLVDSLTNIMQKRVLSEHFWSKLPVGRFLRLWIREAKHATVRRLK